MMNNEMKGAGLGEVVNLPNGIGAKGVVTVELTDAETGKVVERQKAENFISKGMQTVYRTAMLDIFRKGLGGMPIVTTPIGEPFAKMVLTDATHDPEPNSEWLVKGSVIGYAHTDAAIAPTGDYRGTLNPSEGFMGNDRVRIVVDFASNQAVGDVGSVYFTSLLNTPVVDVSGTPGVKTPVFANGGSKAVKYENKYYVLNSATHTITVYNADFTYDKDVKAVDMHGSSGEKTIDFEIHNGYLYMMYQYYGSHAGVYRRSMADLDADPFTDKLMARITISTTIDAQGVAYHKQDNKFYVALSNRLYIYDKDFKLLSENPRYGRDGSSWAGTTGPKFLHYDPISNEVFDSLFVNREGGERVAKGGGMSVLGIFDDHMLMGNTLYPRIGFTSRFKLPSPVTKTSNVTMKVTYDFLLPTIYD